MPRCPLPGQPTSTHQKAHLMAHPDTTQLETTITHLTWHIEHLTETITTLRNDITQHRTHLTWHIEHLTRLINDLNQRCSS